MITIGTIIKSDGKNGLPSLMPLKGVPERLERLRSVDVAVRTGHETVTAEPKVQDRKPPMRLKLEVIGTVQDASHLRDRHLHLTP